MLLAVALLAGCAAFAGLTHLFKHLGWTVPMWVAGIVGLVYCVFVLLALAGYLLYSIDQEVRRGLKR